LTDAAAQMTGWSKAMGIVVVASGVDEVVAELEVNDSHLQAFGQVHGGVYCGLVETVTSMGAWLVAHARGQSVVGLENMTSFVSATSSGTLRAIAIPIARGRKTQVWEATVRNAAKVVAVGRVRFLCLAASSDTT
jgi:uncharacterized protein (TIGR00369 family)